MQTIYYVGYGFAVVISFSSENFKVYIVNICDNENSFALSHMISSLALVFGATVIVTFGVDLFVFVMVLGNIIFFVISVL